jgi:general secretion pathway protein I
VTRTPNQGFTLLEVIVAMAILGLALMAIFQLNAGAIAMHAYSKKLTVASLLARSKMTDVEQDLYDKGFAADDEEKNGDFSDEGWSSFKWRARILAPRTQWVSPEQLIGAIFNIPMGSGKDGASALSSLFGGGSSSSSKSPSSTSTTTAPSGPTSAMGALGALGPMASLLQGQFTQMVDQLTKTVREVHLTVSWPEGSNTETLELVTHVVSLGPGGDRNGNTQAAAVQAAGAARGLVDSNGQPINQPPGGPPLNRRP